METLIIWGVTGIFLWLGFNGLLGLQLYRVYEQKLKEEKNNDHSD